MALRWTVVVKRDKVAQMPPEPSAKPVTRSPFLVLLVEDSPIIAMNTEALLLELDEVGEVRVAFCVAEALGLIEEARFDLAILDLNLGEETSLPVAHRLSRDDIPIVFATGFDEPIDLPTSLRAARMLKKPYSFADLERVLRNG